MVRNQSGSTERPNNLSFSDVFVIKELSNKFNRNQQRARNVYLVIFTTYLLIRKWIYDGTLVRRRWFLHPERCRGYKGLHGQVV